MMTRRISVAAFLLVVALRIDGQVKIADRMTDGADLGLLIVGAITNADQQNNVALVKETQSGRVEAVKMGYKLLDFKVSVVTGKFIMLEKAGKQTLVYQNKFAGEFTGSTPSTRPGAFAAANDNYSEDGFERKGNKVKISGTFRDKVVNEDLSSVLMQATAIPKVENGEIVGFKVLQIDAGSIYDKAGLKDHDVITSINGVKLNSISGAVKLLQSLRNSADVEINLRRGGTPMQLELSVAH